ncbi:sulfite exporter TauE/SafE family protein [Paenibacillus thermoaerophilus]|nr:sulfite exporter TauE/SafE family protein [Paenibacillus thermoaerophilus]
MGLLVGLLVGLTGVGGAALLTPVLLFMGIHPSIAVGTDLLYNSVTKLFGTIQHTRLKTVNWKLVGYFAMGSIPGAVVAIGLLKVYSVYFDQQEQLLKQALGVMLVIVSVVTLLKVWLDRRFSQKEPAEHDSGNNEKRGLTIAVGFALGFVVGLTSIGSGSLFAIALIYLFKLKGSQVVGTDIAHAFFLVTAAGLLHAGLGHVDFMLALNLLMGSVPGVLIGSNLSARMPTGALRAIMASIIFISGINLL